jgi:hypothetical protein
MKVMLCDVDTGLFFPLDILGVDMLICALAGRGINYGYLLLI